MKEYIISAGDVKALEEEFGINFSFDKRDKLIRCKDCRYNPRNPRKWNDDDETLTYVHCGFMSDDDYCSKAEPKENSNEIY